MIALYLAAMLVPSLPPVPAFEEAEKGGAQSILEACDEAHYGYADQSYTVRILLHEKDGSTREQRLDEAQKGEQRLIRFTAPADVKGVAVLVKDAATMYVYMPSLNKVRLVASHTRKQTFMGSDYTYDEMAIVRFARDYTATLAGQTATDVTLDLAQRPDRDLAYPKLRLEIDKKTMLCHTIHYMDGSGKTLKREDRDQFKVLGGYPLYSRMWMHDLGSGHSTEMTIEEQRFNQGLDDSFFSKRNLVRGE